MSLKRNIQIVEKQISQFPSESKKSKDIWGLKPSPLGARHQYNTYLRQCSVCVMLVLNLNR